MEFVRVGDHNLAPPEYAPGVAGLILRNLDPLHIPVRGTAIVNTGFTFRVPAGYVGMIHTLPAYTAGIPMRLAVAPVVYGGAMPVRPASMSAVRIPFVNPHDEPIDFGSGYAVAQLLFIRDMSTPAILVDDFSGEFITHGGR